MYKLLASLLALIGCTSVTEPELYARVTVQNKTGYTAWVIASNDYAYKVGRYESRTLTLDVPQTVILYHNDDTVHITVTKTTIINLPLEVKL